MVRFELWMPEPLIKALKALAERTDISIAEHVRRAIEAYLRRKQ